MTERDAPGRLVRASACGRPTSPRSSPPGRAVGWLEVHAENYLGGGPAAARARGDPRATIRSRLHGVGLSLGSADGARRAHLARVRALVDRFEPALVSEHLSWSIAGGAYLNHLLPLPYTEEALDAGVPATSTRSRTRSAGAILVENPSSYLRFADSTIPEPEFLAELARRTGCGLLCDVNNIYVSCRQLRARSRRLPRRHAGAARWARSTSPATPSTTPTGARS